MIMQYERPLIVTIFCIIGFVTLGLSVFGVPMMYGMIMAAYGDWYGRSGCSPWG
jgi:uncharacterized membrane protein SpoIIM required for sporulation